jgi:hypothetical protein
MNKGNAHFAVLPFPAWPPLISPLNPSSHCVTLVIMSETVTDHEPLYVLGRLDRATQARFAAGVVAALVIMSSIGFSVLRPWDPYAAISLRVADSPVFLLVRASALLLAVAVLCTIILDGRLPQFGTFAACVGLLYPVAKTGTMAYLMVWLQEGKEFGGQAELRKSWEYMAVEMLVWTLALLAMVLASCGAERWLTSKRRARGGEDHQPSRPPAKLLHSVLSVLITAVAAALLVALFGQSMAKGQVIFAVSAAFFLAALAADQLIEQRDVMTHLIAVPIVGLGAYIGTATRPDRPPGQEALLHVAPNHLASVLPIEYLAAGAAGAILGFWFSEKLRFTKAET